jgi:tRNA(Ile)-lysidine synthase
LESNRKFCATFLRQVERECIAGHLAHWRYHPLVRASLPLDTTLLKPGLRLAIGLSGGADSVALLRALVDRRAELGLVLHVAHLHHGLRGDEANADLDFARALAAQLDLPFHHAKVNTAAEAKAHSESIEEAARRLRYTWFRQLLTKVPLHAVATAHTLDDQAETVLAKFLRGAWTEGLSGIHPKLECPEGGRILRPLLPATRAEVEAYLNALGQPWREDSSNRDAAFTRNRIRHELLPLLEKWNPRLPEHLAHMAALAQDEEAWWQLELARVAPQHLLSGRPVRGGGRADSSTLAIDVTRLAALPTALQRRLLRHAAGQLHGQHGAAPDFAATEALRALALAGRAGQRLELAHGFRAERSPRELRLTAGSAGAAKAGPRAGNSAATAACTVAIPGEISAPAFGLHLRIELTPPTHPSATPAPIFQQAILRNWKPGDRVRLRYSSGPRKVKEVLERLRVTGSDRLLWPVLELAGEPASELSPRIAWMRGVELEPTPGISVTATQAGTVEPPAPPGKTSGSP